MIDPINLTKYNRSVPELEEVALFCVLVAGKGALPTARALDRLLKNLDTLPTVKQKTPFQLVRDYPYNNLGSVLQASGIGGWRRKTVAILDLATTDLDLRTCTVEDLENIYCIGPKTARFFLLHTRPNQRIAALDTHLMKHLRSLGHDVPNNTPSSKRVYARLEQVVLDLIDQSGMTPADWDLMIWNQYRRKEACERGRAAAG
jgi:thermostable 8-oxoguanine DNA glycosylase